MPQLLYNAPPPVTPQFDSSVPPWQMMPTLSEPSPQEMREQMQNPFAMLGDAQSNDENDVENVPNDADNNLEDDEYLYADTTIRPDTFSSFTAYPETHFHLGDPQVEFTTSGQSLPQPIDTMPHGGHQINTGLTAPLLSVGDVAVQSGLQPNPSSSGSSSTRIDAIELQRRLSAPIHTVSYVIYICE
jgi:hypothetical protein